MFCPIHCTGSHHSILSSWKTHSCKQATVCRASVMGVRANDANDNLLIFQAGSGNYNLPEGPVRQPSSQGCRGSAAFCTAVKRHHPRKYVCICWIWFAMCAVAITVSQHNSCYTVNKGLSLRGLQTIWFHEEDGGLLRTSWRPLAAGTVNLSLVSDAEVRSHWNPFKALLKV